MASVDAIVDALWGDDPPPSATKTVQSHVVRLRRSLGRLGPSIIETVPGGYRLAIDPEGIDAGWAERLATEGRELLRAGAPAAAAERFVAALELWRGPAYAEFRDADFAAADGVRLDELNLATQEDLAEAWVAIGSAATATSALERLVRNEPGRERAWGLLMRALYSTGRQHEALGAFQRARQVLAESYGLEPGPDLRSLERRILNQDPSLGSTTARVALAAALHTSTPLVGRTSELAALDTAWRMAREGAGQLRILSGPIDVGRTRLAADLAGRAIAVGGDVEYLRAADGLDSLAAPTGTGGPTSPGVIVDAVAHRCRRGPMILIIDDMEWAPGPVVTTIAALTSALEGLALLVVLIVDPSAGGPAVAAIGRLDPEQARTLSVGPMSNADIAAIVVADGVEVDAVPPVVALADGRPGAARREAAAWAERTASDRLRAATVSSAGALAVAQQAQVSVLDEVVELVAARARRDEMRSATWVGRQPYRALASYGPQDAELFVGRERLVAELATRVLERRLVVVVGPSGSGKSSLVRAGLIPLARSGRLPGDAAWRTHIMVPGHDPLAAIDAIEDLDDPGPRLLVVDQFEEVFASLPTVVDGFATRLLDLAGDPALDVHVVIVVRSDEYGALTGVGGLSAASQDAQLLVGPPTDAEMRRIVEEPARRTGVSVEPALVDLVARDVGGYDSALPLVSAAMAEVWERRTGVELSADRYLEIGGLATAVERLGEQVIDRAGSSSEEVRRLLLRLADVTDEGLWTRRRVPIDDVPDELLAAVDALVATRLVVRSETTIEIVHEVVFRAWPRLVCWLEEARADLIRERDLIVAARMWDAEGRSDDNVYRGARLEAGAEWMARHGDHAGALVGPFLEAGRRRAEREADEAGVRLAREVRARRRTTRALLAASVLLVIATVTGVLAARQAGRADTAAQASRRETERADRAATEARDAADAAEAAALAADAERLGALAGLEDELDRSLLLAAQAYTMADTASTRGALLWAVQRSPEAVGMTRSDGARLLAMELSPDGSILAVNENQGGTTLHDAQTGDRLGHFAAANLGGLSWTPDGSAFATVDVAADADLSRRDGLLVDAVIVEASTFTERARFSGHRGPVSDLTFSPDGRLLVAAPSFLFEDYSPAQVTVWDVDRPGPPIRTIELPDGTHNFDDSISFDASGTRVAVSVHDATVLIDVHTGERVGSTAGSAGLFSPDGRVLAVNSGGERFPLTLDLVDVETGVRRTLHGAHTEGIVRREFNRDGTRLVTTGDDRTVRVWDTTTGEELHTLSGHTGRVLAAAFSPDGATLYSAGLDRSIITWDLAGRRTVESVIAPATTDKFSEQVIMTDDGTASVRVPVGTGIMAVTDLGSGARTRFIETGHGVTFEIVNGGGSVVYTGGSDGAVRRWDVNDGSLLAERLPAEPVPGISPLAVTPDRSTLYSQIWDGAVVALDAITLDPIDDTQLGSHPEALDAAISPDGASMAISTRDPPTVSIIDLTTGASQPVNVPGDVLALAFSPDGSSLIGGDADGRVLRIDPDDATIIGEPVTRHDGFVVDIDVAADGARFTSGSTDGNVGLWETATGRYVGTIQPGSPNTTVRSRWATDGHTLVIMYEDGAIYDFDTRPSSWFKHACHTAGRQLFEHEWAELLPDRPYQPTCH